MRCNITWSKGVKIGFFEFAGVAPPLYPPIYNHSLLSAYPPHRHHEHSATPAILTERTEPATSSDTERVDRSSKPEPTRHKVHPCHPRTTHQTSNAHISELPAIPPTQRQRLSPDPPDKPQEPSARHHAKPSQSPPHNHKNTRGHTSTTDYPSQPPLSLPTRPRPPTTLHE